MLLPLLGLYQTLTGAPVSSGATYSGRALAMHARAPRLESDVRIDGVLDEPVWASASRLTDFSEFSPKDGLPAEDSTEVLVWYSPTAIYFGVRAYEPHGGRAAVRATLADRDKITTDDQIQIILGTFGDGRQALVFGVNPLGVQMDGTIVEQGLSRSQGFIVSSAGREAPDLNPDYVYQSKGRLTDFGYEVEIRIPFKSLRYQTADVQSWRLQVVREVQHSGHEQTWTPANRAGASFLAQSGTIDGLTNLRRGLVLDINPEITQHTLGAETPDERWAYAAERPVVGGNVRWGATENITLNSTFHPDFSQIEADAGQFVFDPRASLFFAEKRPFFLDGIEQFNTPNQLIYTRRIVQPVAAGKLTGKEGGTDIAFLSAVDDRSSSISGLDNPVFNILRLQRGLGPASRIGLTYTDKVDGANSNRVADLDSRLVFAKVWSLQAQAAGSRTHTAATDVTADAPLWNTTLSRTGRSYSARYTFSGISDRFVAGSGFISRSNVAHIGEDQQFTWYGRPGALVESFTFDQFNDFTWQYAKLFNHGDAIEKKFHFSTGAALRGGWRAGASVYWETFGFDTALYGNYYYEQTLNGRVDTVKFAGVSRIPNRDYVLNFGTPTWNTFSASLLLIFGQDENFFEWAQADILYESWTMAWRPTQKLRVDGTYQLQGYVRRSDQSTVQIGRIPRLKVEYQLSRAVFVRVVGEYDSSKQAALRDETRTFGPIILRQPDGSFEPALAFASNRLRADWLFSYQPNPGTVLFAGYGSTLTEPDALRFRALDRTSDSFFVKLTYLFRL
ncbi:MAG TPA: DUF5916 domain-containing protein [Gemmatimonadaceae bacterium]